jgi:hypothetical protein
LILAWPSHLSGVIDGGPVEASIVTDTLFSPGSTALPVVAVTPGGRSFRTR